MENSKQTDEQQTELEKQSTDTTIGSYSELLPLLKGKTLSIRELYHDMDFKALEEAYAKYSKGQIFQSQGVSTRMPSN